MRILLLILLSWSIHAQEISELSEKQLQADFDYLERALEKYNPAMYAYHSKEVFKQTIDDIQTSIEVPMGAIELHKRLRLAAAAVNEGHITVGVASDPFYKGFFEDEFKSLPLNLEFLGSRAYLVQNFSDNEVLEQGDEILSINSRPIEQIRQILFKYTSSDGDIESFKQMRISTELAARYFWFVEQPDLFTIEYKKQGSSKIEELELKAMSRKEMAPWIEKRGYKDNRPKGINKFYSLTTVNKTAHLTLRSFDDAIAKENDIEAASFYEDIFRRLRQNKVENLILDVRDNIGGMKSFVDELMPFILKKNQKGIYRELQSWDGKTEISELPKRHRWWFKGKIYVLVNEGTFSTASLIAQYAREYCEATCIGVETGSRYEGFAAGTFQHIQLPNSKITIGIPNKWVKNKKIAKQSTKNRGLIPDYIVEKTLEDLLVDKDRIKEKALELIGL